MLRPWATTPVTLVTGRHSHFSVKIDFYMTKAEWIEKGKVLGATADVSCWAVGAWLVKGERSFLVKPPGNKKKIREYRWQRKAQWLQLMAEAAEITNLSESALRQYARVVRNFDHQFKVEGLSLAHHNETFRCKKESDRKAGKWVFDISAAHKILTEALEKKWTVAQTRAEARRLFPPAKRVESVIEKAHRLLWAVVDAMRQDEHSNIYDLLIGELQQMKAAANPVINFTDIEGEGEHIPF